MTFTLTTSMWGEAGAGVIFYDCRKTWMTITAATHVNGCHEDVTFYHVDMYVRALHAIIFSVSRSVVNSCFVMQ